MRYVYLFIFLLSTLVAEENVSPQKIQSELDQAQAKYERAKKMFNPWYTGPLITPSAGMMLPGHANIQPYIFFGGGYAKFNKNRDSVPLPHNVYSLQMTSGMLTGITSSVDLSFTPSAIVNWQKDLSGNRLSGGGFNDITATLGFRITAQTLYVPAMKFLITETFPTGKYKNLSLNGLGLNSTGGGGHTKRSLALRFLN